MKSFVFFFLGIGVSACLFFLFFSPRAEFPNSASGRSLPEVVQGEKAGQPSHDQASVASQTPISSTRPAPVPASLLSTTSRSGAPELMRGAVASMSSVSVPASTRKTTPDQSSSVSGFASVSSAGVSPAKVLQPAYAISRDSTGGVQIEIGPDVQVPAVMASGAIPASTVNNQAAADAANRIADDFVKEVDEASTSSSSSSSSGSRWDEAAELADERYRALYGTDAYMEMKLKAAKEALANGADGGR